MHKLLNCTCAEKWGDLAPFILRLVVGIIFLVHGYLKVVDVSQVAGFFGTLGIPAAGFFAWVVTLVELLGGIALILGLFSHLASKLLAINMIVAILVVHVKNGLLTQNGGYEFPLLLLAAALSIMITGPGQWALQKTKAKQV